MKKIGKRKLVLEREVVRKLVAELPVDRLKPVIGGIVPSATDGNPCGSWDMNICRGEEP